MKYEENVRKHLKLWANCITGSPKFLQVYFVSQSEEGPRIRHCYDSTLNRNILQNLQTTLHLANFYGILFCKITVKS